MAENTSRDGANVIETGQPKEISQGCPMLIYEVASHSRSVATTPKKPEGHNTLSGGGALHNSNKSEAKLTVSRKSSSGAKPLEDDITVIHQVIHTRNVLEKSMERVVETLEALISRVSALESTIQSNAERHWNDQSKAVQPSAESDATTSKSQDHQNIRLPFEPNAKAVQPEFKYKESEHMSEPEELEHMSEQSGQQTEALRSSPPPHNHHGDQKTSNKRKQSVEDEDEDEADTERSPVSVSSDDVVRSTAIPMNYGRARGRGRPRGSGRGRGRGRPRAK